MKEVTNMKNCDCKKFAYDPVALLHYVEGERNQAYSAGFKAGVKSEQEKFAVKPDFFKDVELHIEVEGGDGTYCHCSWHPNGECDFSIRG